MDVGVNVGGRRREYSLRSGKSKDGGWHGLLRWDG